MSSQSCARYVGALRRSAAVLLTVVITAAAARGDDATNTCVACHTALPAPLNVAVERLHQGDVHAEKGLSCVDCHGGDATAMDMTSMAPEVGFRGVPTRSDIPAFCGRCHADEAFMRRFNPSVPTDQLQQYWTSRHGELLRNGDMKVATCVSCHGAHGILPSDRAHSPIFPANVPATCGHCHSNPEYMAEYGIPTQQEQAYKRSVHGTMLLVKRDLSAPACNDCHGNHGAYPPGVTSVAGVCGQCHANNAALFDKSPHKAAFDRGRLPECAACHGNHDIQPTSDEMLGGEPGAVCRRCHEPGSVGYAAAVQMRAAIENLKAAMATTESTLAQASSMGMEVSDAEYAFRQDVRPQLVTVRTETHLADAEDVGRAVDKAILAAREGETAAQATVAEARARRRNLLIPLALILLLMVLLYAKLRQLESRPPGA